MKASPFFRCVCVSSSVLSVFPVICRAVDFSVDLSATPVPISPYVYGCNDWAAQGDRSVPVPVERQGGNRMTGYNWENNASNAGSDWYHSSDNYLVSSLPYAQQSVPGIVLTMSIDSARVAGARSVMTLPLAGYVAADKNGTVSEAQTAPSSRWKAVLVQKATPLSTTPDTSDGYVYLDEEVNFLLSRYGSASQGGVLGYCLDNEPGLWSSTHPRIHPNPVRCSELVSRNVAAAHVVKTLDGDALVFGPVLYGWSAFMNLQGAPDWDDYSSTYPWFVSYYLAKMKQASDAEGKRLLDVLDLHYYPEAQGNNASGVATRITGSDTSPGVSEARMQAPRSLWDESYTETSWITQWSTYGPIRLLPRLKESIDEYYPGTRISLTEYDFGGHFGYSGGLAQADLLGILGRHGAYLATYWGTLEGFVVPAFNIFLNYDGRGGTFGELSLPVENPDVAGYSAYAARESATGRLHLILINKTASAQVANVTLADSARVFESARVFGFSEAGGAALSEKTPIAAISGNAFSYTLPAHCVLHFVLADPDVPSFRMERDAGAGKLRLYFRTAPGVTYHLQKSADLAKWSDVGSTLYAGDGGVILVEEPLPAAETFWRFAPAL